MKILNMNGKTYAFVGVMGYVGIAEFSDGKMERMGYHRREFLPSTSKEMKEQVESFCDPSQVSPSDVGNVDNDKWHLLSTEVNFFAKHTQQMFEEIANNPLSKLTKN